MGKILSQGGGIQREQRIHGWKEGPESGWSLHVASVEVCRQLVKCKHQVEAEIYQEAQKQHKLENDHSTLKGKCLLCKKFISVMPGL